MARKKETWFDLLASVPWWVSLIFSAFVFVLMRYIFPSHPLSQGGPLGTAMFKGIAKGVYMLAPLVAFLLLLPIPFSLFNTWQRKQILEKQTGLNSIGMLDWKTFEQLVGEAFRRQGYSVTETGQGGADGGVDLALRKGSENFLVQCKQWRAIKVSVNIVRELYGVMAAKGAAGGFVITSGSFTEDAKAFASGRNIELIDGPRLENMIATAQTAVQHRAPAAIAADTTPKCPKCNSPMAKRTARQGANAGGQFWGCSRYPDCKGIRSIR